MRTIQNATWAKLVLGSVAALVVGGPGVVLANGPCPDYLTPVSARILGAASVSTSSSSPYSLKVNFRDGSSTTYSGAPAVFSVTASSGSASGSFSGNSLSTGAGAGALVLKGEFANDCGKVESTRRVGVNNSGS